MDEALRNKIWSALVVGFFQLTSSELAMAGVNPQLVTQRLWVHHFGRPIDMTPQSRYDFGVLGQYLRDWFFKAPWHDVYDLVEAVLEELPTTLREPLSDLMNGFLESEMSAYRVVGQHIGDITNADEIESIERALTDVTGLAGVRTHLADALAKLTDRQAPDYRNSIKESISAVEALCQAITQNSSATLGQALKRLANAGITLHPSLRDAWSKLYGYTSDEGGIRHALSDEPNITFEDAKYMLVSCSSFVSYLLALAAKASIAVVPASC